MQKVGPLQSYLMMGVGGQDTQICYREVVILARKTQKDVEQHLLTGLTWLMNVMTVGVLWLVSGVLDSSPGI